MFGLMAPTWFLSLWMSNSTATVVMVPMAKAILLQLKETGKAIEIGTYIFLSIAKKVTIQHFLFLV